MRLKYIGQILEDVKMQIRSEFKTRPSRGLPHTKLYIIHLRIYVLQQTCVFIYDKMIVTESIFREEA